MTASKTHTDEFSESTWAVYGRVRDEEYEEVFFADWSEEAESQAFESRPGLDPFSLVALRGR